MRTKYNPVHKRGERNVFCPYYKDCLSYACKHYWEYWSCLACNHRREKEPIADLPLSSPSADPYYSISPSICFKGKDPLQNWN